MMNISTGDVSSGDGRDGDRKNLPITQVDDEEMAKHSGIGPTSPRGRASASLAKPRARAATTRSGKRRSRRHPLARCRGSPVATRAGERCAAGVVIFGFAEADREQ
jgi:hypothetical protein